MQFSGALRNHKHDAFFPFVTADNAIHRKPRDARRPMNPYPCVNPAAVCNAWPGVNALNQPFGCLRLSAKGVCTPDACPALGCGATCPPACPTGKTLKECQEFWTSSQTFDSDCSAYYLSLFHAAANQALPGCADGSAETSGTCAVAYDDTKPVDAWSWAPSAPASGYVLNGPVLAYQNYYNELWYCFSRTCGCPTTPGKSGTALICSGHGECQAFYSADTSTMAYSCSCVSPYTGTSCAVKEGSKVCGMGWDAATQTVQVCSGAARGVCVSGECDCFPGYDGDACEQRTCPTVNNEVCAGNGVCSLTSVCLCDEGFSGEACNCKANAAGDVICHGTVQSATGAPGNPKVTPPPPASSPKSSDATTIKYAVGFGIVVITLVVLAWVALSGHKRAIAKKDALVQKAIAAALAASNNQT